MEFYDCNLLIVIQFTLTHLRFTVRGPAYSRILLSKFFHNFVNFVNFLGHFFIRKSFWCVICNYIVSRYYLRPIMPTIFLAEKVFGVLCLIGKHILAYITTVGKLRLF